MIRGISVDDTSSATDVVFVKMSEAKNVQRIPNSKYATFNSRKDPLRNVKSAIPCSPPSIPLPETPRQSIQTQPRNLLDTMDSSVRLEHLPGNETEKNRNINNPFLFQYENMGVGADLASNDMQKGQYTHNIGEPKAENWQFSTPRRTNSTDDIFLDGKNNRYGQQVGSASSLNHCLSF